MLLDLLSFTMVLSSFFVIICTNQVHALFFLVSVFLQIAVLLLVHYGLEFVPFLIVIVYVGAIAILFLFVVMMLDINTPAFSTNKSFFVATILVFLFTSSFWVLYLYSHSPFIDPFIFRYFKTRCFSAFTIPNFGFDWSVLLQRPSDLFAISSVLYTHYFSSFLLSAYVLLVSMLGAISLTLKQKPSVKRQVVVTQNVRDFETLYKVSPKLERP